jgi:hypothetical protein
VSIHQGLHYESKLRAMEKVLKESGLLYSMQNITERVALHADIDTRRALGIYGRLPKRDFNPRPLPPTSWRYWPDQQKAIYFCVYPEEYELEVHHGITCQDSDLLDGSKWSYLPGGRVWVAFYRKGKYYIKNSKTGPLPEGYGFSWGQDPEFISV